LNRLFGLYQSRPFGLVRIVFVPRDGTATRERILDAAEGLVIEHGFAATSVDRVLEAASTSKGAFFHHFPTKTDLGRALVERYVAADLAHLEQALDAVREVRDPVEQALGFVRFFEERYEDLVNVESGCLYLTVLSERDFTDAGTRGPVLHAIERWREEYAVLLRVALGDRVPEVDVEALSDHLFTTFEGAFMLCRAADDPALMRRQLTTYRMLLEALLR
jgi:TetR/AcrR family transcriptional regulator, transcriptional repressor for nem operon